MAIGSRTAKVDGIAKVEGLEKYGADYIPADALWVRIIRSTQARATVALGDFSAIVQKYGLVRVFTRSAEHTSELQTLMRTSHARFCLKKKKKPQLRPPCIRQPY